VTAPTTLRPPAIDPQDRRLRRTWWLLAGSLLVLALGVATRLATQGILPIDVVLAVMVAVVANAAILHRNAVQTLETARRSEVESFARILQGLSRSVSADAIVDAIVAELGTTTGADHIVVVRRAPQGNALEATLVTSSTNVGSSTTSFPLSDLDDPRDSKPALPFRRDAGSVALGSGAPRRIAGRIAARAREVYGLTYTLAAPLRTDDRVVGAIILSRRTANAWPRSAQRILAGAAVEASAALARAFSHREAEARASTDSLTGLPNRRYFDEFCGLVARRRRADDAVGVLMIDIDRFKSVNDLHGHAVGDEVLRAVAGAITGAVREEDVPARVGGEEFAVLLRNPGPGVAIEVGERVRGAVERLDLRGLDIDGVTVSVGVAVGSEPDQPIVDLVAQADTALYEAKRRGRDRVVAA
jgi:diguanylate cyclase (GGDEF)-like protein